MQNHATKGETSTKRPPTRLLGRLRELLAAHQRVDERRLADVGAPDEHELGEAAGGALGLLAAALDELRELDDCEAPHVRADLSSLSAPSSPGCAL